MAYIIASSQSFHQWVTASFNYFPSLMSDGSPNHLLISIRFKRWVTKHDVWTWNLHTITLFNPEACFQVFNIRFAICLGSARSLWCVFACCPHYNDGKRWWKHRLSKTVSKVENMKVGWNGDFRSRYSTWMIETETFENPGIFDCFNYFYTLLDKLMPPFGRGTNAVKKSVWKVKMGYNLIQFIINV